MVPLSSALLHNLYSNTISNPAIGSEKTTAGCVILKSFTKSNTLPKLAPITPTIRPIAVPIISHLISFLMEYMLLKKLLSILALVPAIINCLLSCSCLFSCITQPRFIFSKSSIKYHLPNHNINLHFSGVYCLIIAYFAESCYTIYCLKFKAFHARERRYFL